MGESTRLAAQIPNLLTLVRVLLAPLVAVLVVTTDDDASRWITLIVFLLAASTDGIDGWFARRFNVVSRLGAFIDPVADKLLILGAFGALVVINALPLGVFLVVVARELLVTLLRLWLIKNHRIVMPASLWGKTKTVAQIVALSFYLAPIIPTLLQAASMSIAVALTVWSGVEYVYRARRLINAT
jgi:CDP-diacylglycerol--glycerol-3-phosphate 3-phosphatidyltransferase